MKRPISSALGKFLALLLIFSALQGEAQPILDQVSAPSTVAYSLRQVKSTATRAIQVRRSSDNALMDIGFTAGGDLDQAALLAFVGSGNGYVVTLYDQSGNSINATQATLIKQPMIVNAGVVYTQNGRPTCDFNGITSTMATGPTPIATPLSLFLVTRRTGVGTTTTGAVSILDGINNNSFQVGYPNTANPVAMGIFPHDWSGGAALAPVPQLNNNSLFLYSALSDASSGTQYLNGGEASHSFGGITTSLGGLRLFKGDPLGPNDNEIPAGQLSELILFSYKLGVTDWQLLECSESIYYTVPLTPGGLDFFIRGNVDPAACSQAKEQVSWRTADFVNVQAAGSNLTKFQSTNWDGGAASWNTVSDNGYLQFTAGETDKARMIGLSNFNTNNNYNSIQYAIYLTNGGNIQIYESGNNRGGFGAYVTGDLFKITVESGVVKYYKNGTLLYISSTAPSLPMLVDVSIYDKGGTVTNPVVSNYNSGSFTAGVINAGPNPVYQWYLNGNPVGTNSNTYTNTSLNVNDVLSCKLMPDILGCSAIPVISNNITDTAVPPVNVEFLIQGTPAVTNCSAVTEEVRWKFSELTPNMLIVGANGLSKFGNGGWDGGAASWNTVSDNGYFQFTATETNKSRMAGLSTTNASASYNTIQYAFYLVAGNSLQIYESGNGRGSFGTYTTGDVLKIAVEGGVVRYYKNGILLYVSNTAPALPLLVDVSVNDKGGTIANPVVSNYNAGTFTATALNAGANPSYQWMLNGSPVGTNSNTYANAALNDNDVVTCMLTPNLPGCTAAPVPSNAITRHTVPPLNIDFSIQGIASVANCNSVIEQVKWKLSELATNMTVVGINSLSKFQNNGWDGGAASWNTVSNNGYLQFTATETNKARVVGLSTTNANAANTTIQFGFYLQNNGILQVIESGSGRANFGPYAPGDILKIAVENNVVKYYKNGALLYISNLTPTLPMLVDVSFYEAGSTISNVLVSNYNSGSFIANAVNAGVSPSYQWMLNGSPVGTNSNTYTNTSLAANDVVTCILSPNLSGCTSTPVLSNALTDTVLAPLNLDFAIQGTAVAASCVSVVEQVKWKLSDLTPNMTIAGTNSLSKFSGNAWDGGAASWNTVSNNGYFQFTATETNKSRMAGLSTNNASASYTTIQYAFFAIAGGSLQIYESGSYRGTFGTYAAGDIFRIAVEANIIKYYKNGVLLYISNVAPTLPLQVDVSISDAGGTITNALVSNMNAGTFTATAANAGANPVYQWMLNGSPVGTNSNTYTNTSLSNGDVVSCALTADLAGCAVTPVLSNNLVDTVTAPFGMDFSIQGVAAASSCNAVVEQVKWKLSDLTYNMTITGSNALSKFSGNAWDGGAASWNTVSNNGYFQFTATETNKSRMAGLSNSNASASYNTIQYAFYLVAGGSLQIYESGAGRGGFGTYTTGDVLKIAVENNVVKYYKNGTLLYVSTVTPALPLLVDVSINDAGGTVGGALVSNYNAGDFVATAVNAGPSPSYQWLLNGNPVGTNSSTYTNTSLNNGDVVSCMMTPNLSGCTTVPVPSNTITDSVTAPIGLDFSIQGVAAISSCNAVIEQVKWKLTDLTPNMTIVGTNGLSKFQGNGWDGGAASWNTVSNNGYFQFTAAETNKSRMAGLSTTNVNANYTSIQYAFFLVNGGSLQIYESGSYRGTFGTYGTGDIFKIAVEANVIKYYKNGTLLYISGVAPTLPLLADVSISDAGGTIGAAQVYNYNAGDFVATAVNAGASPSYQWLLNGNPVGTNSSTYTNTTLNNNDLLTCMLTPNLSGCTSTPVASNSIRDTVVAPFGLDFSIQGVAAASSCNAVIEQVQWKLSDLANNMTVVGTNSLSKFQGGAWDGGASSWNTVSNNGYFQFTATETNKSRVAGLSASYTGPTNTTIQYGIYLLSGGSLQIIESGSNRGTFGTYAAGDLFKISVESNIVRYYKNGAQIYVSNVAPTLPLLVDVSILHAGGTVTNAFVSNYNTGTFIATAVNAGAAPLYQWLLNGSPVGTNSNTYTNTSLANNDVVSCVLTPNLTGCTIASVNSNTIRDTVVAPLGLDFTIQGTPVTSSCNGVIEQVKWKLSDLTSNMIIAGTNSLSKFQGNGWDGGAASWNTVSNNGFFRFTATETNKARMAGLSASNANANYTSVQYAFHLVSGGSLQIYESGSNRGTFGTYATGDVFKIAVESNVVKYYKNGTLLYVSTVTPTLPLLADVSINDAGGTVTNAQVYNYNSGTFTATAVNAGASPTYQWLLNGNPVGTNSNTYTNATLANNDVVTCLLTPNLSGCTSTPVLSNTITDTLVVAVAPDFSIQGVASATSCSAEIEQVRWKQSTISSNMTLTGGNTLTKFQSNAWDGGAASWNTVSNNGYFQFTATETTTSRMAGLSTTYSSPSYTTIQYAFYLVAGGTVQIYESGGSRGGFGTYTTGDIFRISVESNVVKYYRNGVLLYNSSIAPTLPLLADVSFNTVGSTIGNPLVSNYNAGSFIANVVNAGASPVFTWKVNGSIMQTGVSATYTNAALVNGDVVTCDLTPNIPGCSAATYPSNTATIVTAGNSTTWTGAISNNWFTPSNWSAGYPDKFTSAIIPSGTPNNPVISTDASVYDVTINSGASLTITGTVNLYVYRNFTNNGSFVPNSSTVSFVGCSAQGTISSSGTTPFYNVVFNSPYGVVNAAGTMTIAKNATFTNGIVKQNATLTFLNGSAVIGVSDASHVWGPVNKVGNSAFTFPVGDNLYYRSISISNPTLATDMFTANYFFQNPNPTYPTNLRDITLNNLSNKEYWTLNRTNGASNVAVTLSWNVRSGTITSMGQLDVVGWDAALNKWKDRGNGGSTGGSNAGTVRSAGSVSVFSGPFTLSSLTVNNVLPVKLLYFRGNQVSAGINRLEWSTANEQNSDYFTLERSSDGIWFEGLSTVKAAGNSDKELAYSADDTHLPEGNSWYRLKLTNLDGSVAYSGIVLIGKVSGGELTVYPNPTRNSLFVNLKNVHALSITIIDNTGREVISPMRTTGTTMTIDVSHLISGLYFVLIDMEDKSRVVRKIRVQK